jgi:hypothetical protein
MSQYATRIRQGVTSAGNSSTATLLAGGVFTGKSEDVREYASIIVTVHPDVRSATDGLSIEFSHDNSIWHVTDTYTIHADAVKTYTFQPVMRYFRLVYTNGSVAQSSLHLQVQYRTGVVKASSHRAQDSVGGQDDAELVKAILEDRHGHAGEFNFMRDMRVSIPHRLVGTAFHGTTIDSNFWNTTVSGAGAAVAQADTDLTLSSGTANSGYAHLNSVQTARFIFAHPMLFRAAVRISDSTVAGNTRRWGVFSVDGSDDPLEGVYFQLDENGVMAIESVTGGTPATIAQADWNGDLTGYTVDANIHAYEIHYFVMRVEFYIDQVLVHTINAELQPTNPVSEFTLPISATSVNSASGTTSGDLDVHAAVIIRLGKATTDPICKVHPTGQTAEVVAKYSPGALHKLIISSVTNNAQIVIYDNTAASGTILFDSGAMGAQTQPFELDFGGLPFFTGLTFKVITANAALTLVYE